MMKRPTYKTGYAGPADSAYPNLWRGCVGAWNPGLGPGSLLRDESGFANHGVLTGGPIWTTDETGYAMQFDGVNDYVAAPTSSNYELGVISVSWWIRKTASTNDQSWLTYTNTTSWSRGWGFDSYADAERMSWWVGSYTSSAIDPEAMVNGTLYHFCGTFDGTDQRLYRSGEFVDSAPSGPPSYAGVVQLEIGRGRSNSFNTAGTINDVRVYNRVLDLAEIKQLSKRPGIAYEVPDTRMVIAETVPVTRRIFIIS